MKHWALGMLALAAVGCGGSDDEPKPSSGSGDIEYPAMGALTGESGKGSFRFGAASAATQIEDQNQSTDWYVFTQPKADGGLGNGTFVGDAARGYSMALQDVGLMSELGLDAYRFSVEWARIEPQRDVIDEDALAHYDAFIDELLAAGIRPMITVHHFSNPTWVDDPADPDCATGPSDANLCGWNHPSGGPQVAEELAEHAALLAERYGDRVDEWATLNEPMNYLLASYGLGSFPPGKSGLISDVDGVFVAAARNFVAGHAAVYVALKEGDTTDADGDGVAAAVGLTKARDNRDLAIGLLEYIASREGQETMVKATRQYSVRNDVPPHPLMVRLGDAQGLRDGKFKIDFVPLAAMAGVREQALRVVNEIGFDDRQ